MEKFYRGIRATRRAIFGLGMVAGFLPLVALQGFVIGPLARKSETVKKIENILPTFFYNSLRRLFGIKLEFNRNSAPIENNKLTWYVANHMSMADFLVMGSLVKGTFAGKGDILRWPVVAPIARAAKYIGIYRVPKRLSDGTPNPEFPRYHKMTMGKIASNFNQGCNTITFNEGTTTDGSIVAQMRAGLISMLFGEVGTDKQGNDIPLEKDVVVQPVAIRVKDVEGKDINEREDLRRFYSHYNSTNTIKRIWTRLATKSITIEITAFPAMDPKDYDNQFDLINAAADRIRRVVAPNQTEVRPAIIPDVDGEQQDTQPDAARPN